MKFFRLFLPLFIVLFSLPSLAFTVNKITLDGNERIKRETVMSYVPFEKGESLTVKKQSNIVKSLYDSGLFKHIELLRDGSELIIKLKERPAIANIAFEGNVMLKSEDIKKVFKQVDLLRGRIYNKNVLEKLRLELKRTYYNQGKYGVKMDIKVEDLPRNRVDIFIDILEGFPAKIKSVNIIGNQAYKEKDLKKKLKTGVPSWWAIFSSRDKYAKPKLEGDLETLRAWYLDRGYMKFDIESQNVSISPDKKDLYVDISIKENGRYTVSKLKLAGSLIVPEDELRALMFIKEGDAFSRKRIQQVSTLISKRLGNEGYAKADVNIIPEVDDKRRTVELTFFVKPGKRYRIRNINFLNNNDVHDVVLRREMRQLEGSWYEASKVERSKVRLQRLSFIENVATELAAVPGAPDQLDLNITVRERSSGNLKLGAGYSGGNGAVFNAGVSKDNIFGTGNSLSFNFDTSKITQSASLSYNKPYFTINGVSRGYNLYYRETKANRLSSSDYILNVLGAGVNFGVPLTEYSRMNIGINADQSELFDTFFSPQQIKDFLYNPPEKNTPFSANCAKADPVAPSTQSMNICAIGPGKTYTTLSPALSFSYDTRNRSIFADKGMRQTFSLEATLPGSDLEFFKTGYAAEYYIPSFARSVFIARYDLDYGSGYGGGLKELPPYEKYYAGGVHSVRGYRSRSLISDAGTIDSIGRAYGGDLRTIASLEYVLPPPKNNNNMRFSIFYDTGNVYSSVDEFDPTELRASYGIGLKWLTPFAPLVFSYAEPVQNRRGDRLNHFQFTLGGNF